jgi:small-conductance mechanosensitive channel
VVYWVGSSDYNDYVNTHHEILVSLVEIFGKAGLEFAYPHQVSLQKTANAPHAHA